ncbi:PP2C family protein-serine/threonine phosphatase [Simiduia aestuariiviva]|uniref:Protein phosphatase n=1 Tax=Simiduia aestuariiviva TaxID=1510459 RepID=A0A839UR67_9GAMM|nr:protein phosphatase 2C domain-containing protein [Simiduia aestuariiviva]MBB3168038.1 protein phosphatase [Simiduia aestuariiviva]
MSWVSVHRSHAGLVRQRNEDAVLATDNQGLWIVADGMGGHAGGDVASALVCETIAALCTEGEPLARAVVRAHDAVRAKAQSEPMLHGMGSTVVAAQAVGRQLEIAWVGDSRVYLWRNGQLGQLSRDHSFVQDMVDRGVLSAEEARVHPKKNLVNQALGQANLHRLRVGEQTHKANADDLLLLCTDGIHDFLSDAEIAQCLGSNADLANCAEALHRAVLATDASDNFSFILLRAQPGPLARWLKRLKSHFINR